MEKRQGSRSKEPAADDLRKRDPEVYKEEKVESDDLKWNRKQENIERTRNVQEQNSLQTTENNLESCAEEKGLKQETDVNLKHRVEGLTDTSLVRAQNLKQKIQRKVDALNQECDELPEDEIMEPERNITVQRIIKSRDEILIVPAQYSIPTAKHYSDDTAQQELDRNVKNEHVIKNGTLQEENEIPRKLSVLSSETENFGQPCEVSEENGKIKEEEYIIQQKSATPCKISETPTEAEAIQYDAHDQERMQREKELSKLLADFFSNQNQVILQQRIESPEEILIAAEQDPISTAEQNSNNAAQQELQRNAKSKQLETNKALQQKSELPKKISISSKTESLQESHEVSVNNLKVQEEQDMVKQQESATTDRVSETSIESAVTRYEEQDQEMIKRKQKLPKTLADYYSKQNQVDQQETEIGDKKNKQIFEYSEEIEPQKLKDTVTYEELQEIRKRISRELANTLTNCRSESEDDLLARTQVPSEDAKECKKEENGVTVPISEYHVKSERPLTSKAYVTLHKQESDDITALSQKPYDSLSGLPRRSNDSSKHLQKTKDYVTSFRRDCVTECSSKTKGYVTLPSRKSFPLTSLQDRFLETKGYVTTHFAMQETTASSSTPPTHGFLPVPRFRENPFGLGSATQMHVPPQSLQEPSSTPESEEPGPSRISLGTQQLEEERLASSSALSRTRLRQALRLQNQRLLQEPKDDDFQLVPFEEVSLETTVETNALQRNWRILGALMQSLSTGIQGFMQRLCDRCIPFERRALLITVCMPILFILLAGGIVTGGIGLYLAIESLINESNFVGSNVASPLYDSYPNLRIAGTNIKYYHQSVSMDGKMNTPGTQLVDSNANLTTPVVDSDVNITNSWAILDSEIIPGVTSLNDTVNTPEINSESNMATLVTNLNVTLIHFNFDVTAPFNYFDVNVITPVPDLDNDINPVTDMNFNITIPVIDLSDNLTRQQQCLSVV